MVMRFPAKTNADCPKAPRDFLPRKDGILNSPPGCLRTPLPLPQSLSGRRMPTSQPKFLRSIGYQISLAMELRWWALRAGSATNWTVSNITHVAYQNISCNGVTACEGLDTYPGLTSGGNIMLCTLCIHIDLTVFRTWRTSKYHCVIWQ